MILKGYEKVNMGGRQSNIEALRLLSMLMVLNLHSCWCFDACSGIGQGFEFLREATSICAVDVFLIISGYFGIKWKLKSFFNLMFQLFFYSFGVYLVASGLGFIDFSLHDLAQCAKATYASWGFISGYVVLYFVAPLINAFVEKVGKKELLVYILVFYGAKVLICRYEDYFLYFLLYLVGKLIRKTELVDRLKVNASLGYWLMTSVIFALSYGFFHFAGLKTADQQSECILALSYASPFIIIQALFLFVAFARMKFQSSVVNWLSASCLSIFLIHMHPAIKEIGYYAYSKSLYDLPVLQHIGILTVLIVGVFFGSIMIDKVRIQISSRIYMLLRWLWIKLFNKKFAIGLAMKTKSIVYNG